MTNLRPNCIAHFLSHFWCEKTLLSNQFVIVNRKNICVIFRTFCYRIRLETNNGFRGRRLRGEASHSRAVTTAGEWLWVQKPFITVPAARVFWPAILLMLDLGGWWPYCFLFWWWSHYPICDIITPQPPFSTKLLLIPINFSIHCLLW